MAPQTSLTITINFKTHFKTLRLPAFINASSIRKYDAMNKPNITISQSDYTKISTLIDALDCGQNCDRLIEELERADIVPDIELPSDVVRMHSTVTFAIATTHRTFTLKLVYPFEKNEHNSISILTPAGSALIGLAVGQRIEWALTPNGVPTFVMVKSVRNL